MKRDTNHTKEQLLLGMQERVGCCLLPGWWFSHSVMSSSFVTPWTVAHQAPLSMVFSRQEHWSVCGHFLLQGLFLTQGLQADSLPSEPQGLPRGFLFFAWKLLSPALQEDSLPSEPQGLPLLRLEAPNSLLGLVSVPFIRHRALTAQRSRNCPVLSITR